MYGTIEINLKKIAQMAGYFPFNLIYCRSAVNFSISKKKEIASYTCPSHCNFYLIDRVNCDETVKSEYVRFLQVVLLCYTVDKYVINTSIMFATNHMKIAASWTGHGTISLIALKAVFVRFKINFK